MSRRYCTLDHADKRRELAEQTPYQFWLLQVRRGSAGRVADGTGHRQSTAPGGHGTAPPAARAARGDR